MSKYLRARDDQEKVDVLRSHQAELTREINRFCPDNQSRRRAHKLLAVAINAAVLSIRRGSHGDSNAGQPYKAWREPESEGWVEESDAP